MNGAELSKQFWQEAGYPAFAKGFPEEIGQMAFGLVGEGSECLGEDDRISEDHDFGPGFCIWLPEKLYREKKDAVQECYSALPDTYHGYPVRKPQMPHGDRVGVQSIREFFGRYIGAEQPPQSLMRWMLLDEERLAMAVDGEVYADPLGEFTRIRKILQQGYPEDVRIKKMASRIARIAQAGQYNYARCMRRGEYVAASQAEAIFVRNVISLVGLLNRTCLPYYKWAYRKMSRLPILGEQIGKLLLVLCETGLQREAWEEKTRSQEGDYWNPYCNLTDAKVRVIEEICRALREELKNQGLSELPDAFLEPHAWELMKHIRDAEIRALHVMEG